jgi:hypothetical protein
MLVMDQMDVLAMQNWEHAKVLVSASTLPVPVH